VGETVQVSRIVMMRLRSWKRMITLQFSCPLICMKDTIHAGWFYPVYLWRRGGNKMDLATCCRPWAHTQSLMEKRTC